jgi:hypothetical protein
MLVEPPALVEPPVLEAPPLPPVPGFVLGGPPAQVGGV